VEDREDMIQEEFRGARLRVYGTNREDPDEGRMFVWTKTGWFERIEGSSGGVAFTPIADSEEELRDSLAQDDPKFDLIELGGDHRKTVFEEFREQSTSDQDFLERAENQSAGDDEDQQYHQHDL
jgi:hypothetical protein